MQQCRSDLSLLHIYFFVLFPQLISPSMFIAFAVSCSRRAHVGIGAKLLTRRVTQALISQRPMAERASFCSVELTASRPGFRPN